MIISPVTIRPAGLADARLLSELNGIVHCLHVTAAPHFFKNMDSEALRGWFEEMLVQEQVTILIGYVGAEPAGYVLLLDRSRPESIFTLPLRSLVLDQIAVKEEHRRAGLGRKFVEAAREIARQRGITRLQLTVWSFNRAAQAFFTAQGFQLQYQMMEMETPPGEEA